MIKSNLYEYSFYLCGSSRYLLKYFKEIIGGSGKIVATDMQLSAPALLLLM